MRLWWSKGNLWSSNRRYEIKHAFLIADTLLARFLCLLVRLTVFFGQDSGFLCEGVSDAFSGQIAGAVRGGHISICLCDTRKGKEQSSSLYYSPCGDRTTHALLEEASCDHFAGIRMQTHLAKGIPSGTVRVRSQIALYLCRSLHHQRCSCKSLKTGY